MVSIPRSTTNKLNESWKRSGLEVRDLSSWLQKTMVRGVLRDMVGVHNLFCLRFGRNMIHSPHPRVLHVCSMALSCRFLRKRIKSCRAHISVDELVLLRHVDGIVMYRISSFLGSSNSMSRWPRGIRQDLCLQLTSLLVFWFWS